MKEKDAPTALRVWLARNPSIQGKQLAAQIGCFPQRISEWLGGKSKPSRSAACALERITGGDVPASAWDDDEPPLVAA